jgi:hypothetical protein
MPSYDSLINESCHKLSFPRGSGCGKSTHLESVSSRASEIVFKSFTLAVSLAEPAYQP